MLEMLMRNDRGRTEDALDAQEERTGILLAISSIFMETTTRHGQSDSLCSTIVIRLRPQSSLAMLMPVSALRSVARYVSPFSFALRLFLVPMARHTFVPYCISSLSDFRTGGRAYCIYVSQHPRSELTVLVPACIHAQSRPHLAPLARPHHVLYAWIDTNTFA